MFDTFVICQHTRENLDRLLELLNNIEESIKFTIEIEKNDQILLLYILVLKQNGSPKNTVY